MFFCRAGHRVSVQSTLLERGRMGENAVIRFLGVTLSLIFPLPQAFVAMLGNLESG